MTKRGERGRYFAIHQDTWRDVCKLGINAACAFLILAFFSGRDNRRTEASANAIETRKLLSRQKAKQAITSLITNGLIEVLPESKPKHPVYEICLPHDKSLNCLLDDADCLIWLPQEIITGVVGVKSPIAFFLERKDTALLEFFISLYFKHDLLEYGGISPAFAHYRYAQREVSECHQFRIVGFENTTDALDPPYEITIDTGRLHLPSKKHRDNFNILVHIGLIDWVPHLIYGPFDNIDIIVDLDFAENKLSSGCSMLDLAHKACQDVIHSGVLTRAEYDGLSLVPIEKHYFQPQIIGIARLLFRPKTSLTADWIRMNHERAEQYMQVISTVREIGVKVRNAISRDIKVNQGASKDVKENSREDNLPY